MEFKKAINPKKQPNDELWTKYVKCALPLNDLYTIQNTSKPDLDKFVMINENQVTGIINSWKIDKKIKLVMFSYDYYIDLSRAYTGYRAYYSECYFSVVFSTNKDFGHVSIRPESLQDKIVELFNPIEIDFPSHKKFSQKYYVLSTDKKKTLDVIDKEILDYIENKKGIELEFLNRQCILSLGRKTTKLQMKKLCKIGLELNELLNSKF